MTSPHSRIASGGRLPHQRTGSPLYVYDFGSAKPSCLKQVLLPDGKAVREILADAAYSFLVTATQLTLFQRSKPMVKPLSEQLANLSVRARHAEDAFAAVQKEAHDKIEVRKQQARAAATTAVEKVNQEIKSAGDSATRDWNTMKAKVAADMTALRANVAEAKHEHDVKRAERLEWEAGFAIDYAIASVEQANLAVLDAIDGRAQAELAKG
jgi:hypothetical protein